MTTVLTVGHGILTAERFTALVDAAGVGLVVDVRRFPGSRRHPHFGERAMRTWLPAAVGYHWEPALGGRRDERPGSPNVALPRSPFRGYADHMDTSEFAAGVDSLLDRTTGFRVAVMCAESDWTRCHRGLLADHLVLVEGIAVEHLHHDGSLAPHRPDARARRDGRRLVYDVAGQRPLFDT